MNKAGLEDCDVLFIGSIVNENQLPNVADSDTDTYSYTEALKQLNTYINQYR